jgi:hypothetical protein
MATEWVGSELVSLLAVKKKTNLKHEARDGVPWWLHVDQEQSCFDWSMRTIGPRPLDAMYMPLIGCTYRYFLPSRFSFYALHGYFLKHFFSLIPVIFCVF